MVRVRAWSLLCVLTLPGIVHADGGTVQLSTETAGCRITVFTSPTPLRAGPVDVSVLVQDRAGRPLPDAAIVLQARHLDPPEMEFSHPATVETSTNKLLHSAKFELPASGRWRFTLQVRGGNQAGEAQFDVEAAEPLPRWTEMAIWIALPAAPVMLFLLHQVLVRRSRITSDK